MLLRNFDIPRHIARVMNLRVESAVQEIPSQNAERFAMKWLLARRARKQVFFVHSGVRIVSKYTKVQKTKFYKPV